MADAAVAITDQRRREKKIPHSSQPSFLPLFLPRNKSRQGKTDLRAPTGGATNNNA
jgi:hypothetical protein